MTNQQVAAIFERIATLLEIKGEVVYKIQSYHRAAENLREMTEDINELYAGNQLTSIPGVGNAISEKIKVLLETGRLPFLEKLEAEIPTSLIELLDIPEVGPKKAALFWKQGGITSIEALKNAAQHGQIRHLPGMGEKSEKRLLSGIEYLERRRLSHDEEMPGDNRILISKASSVGEYWLNWLRSLPGVQRAEFAGSLRRWKPTIGDLDFVIASSLPAQTMQALSGHPQVRQVMGLGEYKTSVKLHNDIGIQLWAQPPAHFGSLWQFATGSRNHNVRLREQARQQGFSLSERGFVDGSGREIPCATEEEVYGTLGLQWIPPELREDRGEIEAARSGTLPTLLEVSDIIADLHTHTTWSDGKDTPHSMAVFARSRGLKVLAITDHSISAPGMTLEQLNRQRDEVAMIQHEMGESLHLLHGIEVDIKSDGSLDYPDEVLASLDIVVASLHYNLHQPRQVITDRLIKAIRNPHVDIIAHPTGRMLPERDAADLDWDAVFNAAIESGVALEINANPNRLDLNEIQARRAAASGIPVCIDTDAHRTLWMENLVYGVAVARRAWLTSKNVISAWPVEELLEWLGRRGKSNK